MGEEECADAGVRGQECESVRGVEPMQALGRQSGLVNSKDTIGVCSEDRAGVVQVKLAGVKLEAVVAVLGVSTDSSGSESDQLSSPAERVIALHIGPISHH